MNRTTRLGAIALAGVLALGSLTACDFGTDEDCRTDSLAVALAKPGGGSGGGKGGGAKGGGSKGKGSKGSKNKAPKNDAPHVGDDCDDDD